MDLISRKAALSFAGQITPHTNKEVQRIIAQCFEVYAEWLKALPSVGEQTWVPVTERCPETDEPVFVTTKTLNGNLSVNRAYYKDGYWHGPGNMTNVIAWMPMPKPYEEAT